jgi:hypothetical protein
VGPVGVESSEFYSNVRRCWYGTQNCCKYHNDLFYDKAKLIYYEILLIFIRDRANSREKYQNGFQSTYLASQREKRKNDIK